MSPATGAQPAPETALSVLVPDDPAFPHPAISAAVDGPAKSPRNTVTCACPLLPAFRVPARPLGAAACPTGGRRNAPTTGVPVARDAVPPAPDKRPAPAPAATRTAVLVVFVTQPPPIWGSSGRNSAQRHRDIARRSRRRGARRDRSDTGVTARSASTSRPSTIRHSTTTSSPPARICPPPTAIPRPKPGPMILPRPAAVDEGSQCGGRHHLHGGGTEPGRQVGHRQRQLDPAEQLPAGQSHPAGGVPGLRVHLPHPGVGVGEQRRHREDGQRHDHRARRSRGRSAADGQQRHRRNGQGQVGHRTITPPPRPVWPSQSPIGQATRQPSATAARGDRQVLTEPLEDAVRVGPVERVVEPDARPAGSGSSLASSGHHLRRPNRALVRTVTECSPVRSRAHGVSTRPTPARTRSSTRASATQTTVPVMISAL